MNGKTDRQTLHVTMIEAVQVIQSEENDIPLVSGKPAYVRVYLDSGNLPDETEISGSIKIKSGNKIMLAKLHSKDSAHLKANCALQQQRLDWSQSINFLLPGDMLGELPAESISFQLIHAVARLPGQRPKVISAIEGNSKSKDIKVVAGPELVCRMILFKHRDPENVDFLEPTQGEAAAIRRFVESTFPVSKVTWSILTVAAPRRFRALSRVSRDSDRTAEQITRNYMRFFLQLLQLREQDIVHGRDPRTIYLGLIFDPSGRFGGAAMDSPQFPAPHVVALTTPDSDGQLGAHELAHVLGRRHPGIPGKNDHGSLIGQKREPGSDCLNDDGNIYNVDCSGFLSARRDGSKAIYNGLDTRYRGSAPRVLAHDQWFDLMTYRHPKWVSSLTYLGLLQRLQAIQEKSVFKGDKEFDPIREDPESQDQQALCWTVIGEFDLRHRTGRIHYLAPGNYQTPISQKLKAKPQSYRLVQLGWETGKCDGSGNPQLALEPVQIRNFRKLDGSRSVGVFQHTLSVDTVSAKNQASFRELVARNGTLKLLVMDVVVDQLRHPEDREVDNLISKIADCIDKDLPNRRPPNYGRDDADVEVERVGGPGERPRKGGISLEYCIDDGGYYLRYIWNWPEKAVKHLRITTSVACMRKRYLEFEGSDLESKTLNPDQKWETVTVSNRLFGRIWISPVFFHDPRYKSEGRNFDVESDVMADKLESFYESGYIEDELLEFGFYDLDALKEQNLNLRIGISIGFKTKYFPAKRMVDRIKIEAFGSRNYGTSYLSRPGTSRRDDAEYWYRDTGSDPQEIPKEDP